MVKVNPEDRIVEPSDASHELLTSVLADRDGRIMLPVEPERIAEHLGVTVEKRRLDHGIDGLLIRRSGSEPFIAVVNAYTSGNRQRFTLAHELGHYVRDYRGRATGRIGIVEYRNEPSSTGADDREIWANGFAASLLMPASIVRVMWAQGQTPERMARLFGVSAQALTIRLRNLHLA